MGNRIRLASVVVGLKGLPVRALLLLWNRLLSGSICPRPRHASCICRAATWGSRPLALIQQFDKVGWKEANRAPIALQAPHPPLAITGIQALDQIAFYETEVAFGLLGGKRKRQRGPRFPRGVSQLLRASAALPLLPTSIWPCTSRETWWAAGARPAAWWWASNRAADGRRCNWANREAIPPGTLSKQQLTSPCGSGVSGAVERLGRLQKERRRRTANESPQDAGGGGAEWVLAVDERGPAMQQDEVPGGVYLLPDWVTTNLARKAAHRPPMPAHPGSRCRPSRQDSSRQLQTHQLPRGSRHGCSGCRCRRTAPRITKPSACCSGPRPPLRRSPTAQPCEAASKYLIVATIRVEAFVRA